MRSAPAVGAEADAGGPAELHVARRRPGAAGRGASASQRFRVAADASPGARHRPARPRPSSGRPSTGQTQRGRSRISSSISSSTCRRFCAAARAERGWRPAVVAGCRWRAGGRLDRSTAAASAACAGTARGRHPPGRQRCRTDRPAPRRPGRRRRQSGVTVSIHEVEVSQRDAPATPCPAKSATSASRTATGCASRSRFRTPTSSGCPTSGFQTIYRLFNDQPDIVCERVFLPPKQELQSCSHSGARIVTLESQTPVRDFDVVRVLGVVRVGLHQRPDAAAPRRHSRCAPRSATRRHPLDRDRRRRDVRQSRAARAVCRRHCRRRRRSRSCPRSSTRSSSVSSSRPSCCATLADAARLLHPVVLRRRVRRRRHASRASCRAKAPARRRSCARPR